MRGGSIGGVSWRLNGNLHLHLGFKASFFILSMKLIIHLLEQHFLHWMRC